MSKRSGIRSYINNGRTKKKLGAFGGGQGFQEFQTFNEQTKENQYSTVKIKHREDYKLVLHQRVIRG